MKIVTHLNKEIMKLTKSLLIVMVVLTYSCTEQLDVQPEKANTEDIAENPIVEQENEDNLNTEDENDIISSVMFSIENAIGSETNVDIVFLNESENLLDQMWDFGDGSISTLESPTHQFVTAGKYLVTLKGMNAAGTEISYMQELFVRNQGSVLDVLFISDQDSSLNYLDLSTKVVTKLYDVPYNPMGILALDETNGIVYYYDYYQNRILENGLTNDNPKVIIEDVDGVSDLEFDQVNNKLFVALSYDDIIIAYDPTNQLITQTYSSSNMGRFGKVRDMELKDGALFTITPTQSYEAVFKVNITGGNINQLIDYEAGGYGYGVAYDDLNDKIYFNNVEKTSLMRADADGSNIRAWVNLDRYGTVPFTSLCLVGLKVVETRNQSMWSAWEEGSLHIMDIGTSREEVIKVELMDGKFVPFENSGLIQK